MTPDTPKLPAPCKTCGGTREVLHIYERPGSPPGNSLVPCQDCAEQPPAPPPASAETLEQVTECDTCGQPLPTPATVSNACVEDRKALSAELDRRGRFAVAIGMNRGNTWDQIEAHVAAALRRLQSTEQEIAAIAKVAGTPYQWDGLPLVERVVLLRKQLDADEARVRGWQEEVEAAKLRVQSTEQERFNEDHWFAEAQKQAQRAEAAEQELKQWRDRARFVFVDNGALPADATDEQLWQHVCQFSDDAAKRAEAAEQRVADLEQNHITSDWLRADLAQWKHDTVDALQAKLTEAEATIARLTKEQG